MKTFKQMYDEDVAAMNTGAGIAGIKGEPPMPKKKRKTRPLTRNYIEVAGKRKRLYV